MVTFSPHPLLSIRNLVCALACTLTCSVALAQWQWLDASGRKVFSDTAPPQSIPEKNILKRPADRAVVAIKGSETTAPAATGSALPAGTKASGVDEKLEAKRKAIDLEQEAKRKAAEEKILATRADNCSRAKNAKSTVQLGTRIQTVNAKGEHAFMDDNARAAESKRLDGIIASDCTHPLSDK